jgi:hypothetical protein
LWFRFQDGLQKHTFDPVGYHPSEKYCLISATAPDTTGVDIDVPESAKIEDSDK